MSWLTVRTSAARQAAQGHPEAREPLPAHAAHAALRRAVAALVILPLAVASLQACLVPQPLVPADEENDLNDPPRILGRSPEPATVRTQRGCGRQRLELLAVEDMDSDDAIEIRWFVNYQQGNTEPVRTSRRETAGYRDGIRSPPGDFLDLFFSQYEDQVLVVEAVVSDEFDLAPGAEPANRAPVRGKAVAQTTWTVFVEGVQECLP